MTTAPNPIADAVQQHINVTLDQRSEPHPMTAQPEDAFDVHASIAADLRSNYLAKALLARRLGSAVTGNQAVTVLALVATLEDQNRRDQLRPEKTFDVPETPDGVPANGTTL